MSHESINHPLTINYPWSIIRIMNQRSITHQLVSSWTMTSQHHHHQTNYETHNCHSHEPGSDSGTQGHNSCWALTPWCRWNKRGVESRSAVWGVDLTGFLEVTPMLRRHGTPPDDLLHCFEPTIGLWKQRSSADPWPCFLREGPWGDLKSCRMVGWSAVNSSCSWGVFGRHQCGHLVGMSSCVHQPTLDGSSSSGHEVAWPQKNGGIGNWGDTSVHVSFIDVYACLSADICIILYPLHHFLAIRFRITILIYSLHVWCVSFISIFIAMCAMCATPPMFYWPSQPSHNLLAVGEFSLLRHFDIMPFFWSFKIPYGAWDVGLKLQFCFQRTQTVDSTAVVKTSWYICQCILISDVFQSP